MPQLLYHLDQTERVRRPRAADDDHQVDLFGGLDRRLLPLLGRAADLVVDLGLRISRLHLADQVLGVPDRKRGLARDRDPVAVQVERVDVLRVLDEVDGPRRFAHHALRLGMAFAPDIDDLVPLAGEVRDQLVGADDVRAGGVDGFQA